jgi:hypothetical protein
VRFYLVVSARTTAWLPVVMAARGVELDEHALAGKIDHDWKNREEYDADDGAVVDW